MRALPTGTVTFLFTDIEGSTRLLEELGVAYRAVQEDHFRLMRAAIAEGEGAEIRTEGDAFFVVFHTAPQWNGHVPVHRHRGQYPIVGATSRGDGGGACPP